MSPGFAAAPASEHRGTRLRWVVPWFIGMVVVAIVWTLAIHSLTTPKPVAVRLRPDAVVWGDRVFANRTLFARWLKSRGISYEAWAKRHPIGQRIIAGGPRPATLSRVRGDVSTRRVVSPGKPSRATLAAFFLLALVIAGLVYAWSTSQEQRRRAPSSRSPHGSSPGSRPPAP